MRTGSGRSGFVPAFLFENRECTDRLRFLNTVRFSEVCESAHGRGSRTRRDDPLLAKQIPKFAVNTRNISLLFSIPFVENC